MTELRDLMDHLDQVGWSYHPLPEEGLILTRFPCKVPFYYYIAPIEIKLSQFWVEIRALLQPRVSPENRNAVELYLARLNTNCRLARFYMNDDCAILQLDIPRPNCHLGTFLESIKTICRYSAAFGVETSVLGTSPTIAVLYGQMENARVPSAPSLLLREDDPRLDFDVSANRIPD